MENNTRAEVRIVAEDPHVRQSLRALLEAAGYRPVELTGGTETAVVASNQTDEVVPLEELERRAIEQALRVTGGRVAKAAKLLGIGRATLYRRLAARQATALRPEAAPPAPPPPTPHKSEAPPAFH